MAPGAHEAIHAAASGSETWVSILLIVLVLGGFTVLGFIVKQLWKGKDDTDKFIRTSLVGLTESTASCVERNTDCMRELREAVIDLKNRKCPLGNGE